MQPEQAAGLIEIAVAECYLKARLENAIDVFRSEDNVEHLVPLWVETLPPGKVVFVVGLPTWFLLTPSTPEQFPEDHARLPLQPVAEYPFAFLPRFAPIA